MRRPPFVMYAVHTRRLPLGVFNDLLNLLTLGLLKMIETPFRLIATKNKTMLKLQHAT